MECEDQPFHLRRQDPVRVFISSLSDGTFSIEKLFMAILFYFWEFLPEDWLLRSRLRRNIFLFRILLRFDRFGLAGLTSSFNLFNLQRISYIFFSSAMYLSAH